MKTILQIQNEITAIEEKWGGKTPKLNADHVDYKKTKKELAKDKKRVVELRQFRSYLDSGAKEEHLRGQLKTLQTRLKSIKDGYEDWKKFNKYDLSETKLKAKHSSENGLAKINKQIRTLQYLLRP